MVGFQSPYRFASLISFPGTLFWAFPKAVCAGYTPLALKISSVTIRFKNKATKQWGLNAWVLEEMVSTASPNQPSVSQQSLIQPDVWTVLLCIKTPSLLQVPFWFGTWERV